MKNYNIRALAIIPAKADSTRLKRKNLRKIAGKTLVEHAIDYAKTSKYVSEIVVSSEDTETLNIANNSGVCVVGRDKEFMGDREVVDVYVEVFNDLGDKEKDKYTHIIGIQPDHPDRTQDIDKLLEYAVDNKYDDLFTVNPDGSRNGAIRIFKAEHVKKGWVSRRVGSVLEPCTNIHSEEDLEKAEENILKRINNE